MPPERAVVRRSTEALDAYERRFMVRRGRLLHRHKRRAPVWMLVLAAGTPVAGLVVLLLGAWLAGGLLLVVGLLGWMLTAVLRVVVTDQVVSVQHGLFGPTIPLQRIRAASAIDYDWGMFGGWGVRGSRSARMYNMPGDGGRALRLIWSDRGGETRGTYVGMPDPEPTVDAIREAIAALPVVPGIGARADSGGARPPRWEQRGDLEAPDRDL